MRGRGRRERRRSHGGLGCPRAGGSTSPSAGPAASLGRRGLVAVLPIDAAPSPKAARSLPNQPEGTPQVGSDHAQPASPSDRFPCTHELAAGDALPPEEPQPVAEAVRREQTL